MCREGMTGRVGNLEAERQRSDPPMRTSRIRLKVIVVTVLVSLSTLAGVGSDAPPALAAGRVNGPLVPAGGFYVGAYTKHIDGYGQQRAREAMNDLESRLGRRLHINHHFYAWSDVFPSWREPWDIQNDRIPMN